MSLDDIIMAILPVHRREDVEDWSVPVDLVDVAGRETSQLDNTPVVDVAFLVMSGSYEFDLHLQVPSLVDRHVCRIAPDSTGIRLSFAIWVL